MLPEDKRIHTKQDLNEWLQYERGKYGEDNLKGKIREFFPISERDILKKHLVLLRKTEYYTNHRNKLAAKFYQFRLERFQNKYALHIPLNTCGKGLRIMHVGPVLINGTATVGENCTFHINTALVAGGTNDDAPYLEDGVVLGIGSVVLGKTHTSRNVAIGANAVVNKDVEEEDITVAGVPARKISNGGRSSWNRTPANKETRSAKN